MEKSTVYLLISDSPVGTSQLDKLKKLLRYSRNQRH